MSETPLYARISLDRHGIVEAHAGTGKTYTLVRLVLRMLSEPMPHGRGGRPDLRNLLLVTYTEKAAGELKERIRKELVKALRELTEDSELRLHLQGNLDNLEEAWIGTIHGVCQRILKNYPFETRLPFSTEMKDDAEGSAAMLRTAMRGGWSSEPLCVEALGLLAEGQMVFSDDELEAIAQCAAILSDPSARQVLPEATGWRTELKKFVKEAKEARRLADGERPAYMETLQGFLGYYASLEDLDSYACKKPVSMAQKNAWISRMEAVELALRLGHPDETLGKSKEKGVLLLYKEQRDAEGLGELDEWRCQVENHAYIEALGRFQNALRECKNRLASQAVELAAGEWRSFKGRQGMLSFNDLLAVARDSVCQNETLRQALRSQFCYALIDEFQDTSLLQWELFQRLFIGAPGDKPSPCSSLFLVGDPKQSIYSFQGANVDTYLAAAKTVGELGSAESLQVNFRSLPELIDACNRVISDTEQSPEAAAPTGKTKGKSKGQGEKENENVKRNWWKHPSLHYGQEEWAKAPERAKPAEKNDRLLEPWLKRPLRYVPLRGKDSHVKRRWASFVAKSIQGLCGRMASLPDGDKWQQPRPLGYGDFAVLAETNKEAQFYVDALAQAGIPVAKYKQEGIFQSEMAREVRIWCMAIQDWESDTGLLGKVLMTSLANLTAQEAACMGDHGETLDRVTACLRHWRSLAEERRWARLVRSMQRDGGVEDVLLRLADGDRRVSDLRQVLEHCHGYLDEGGHDLADLVEHLRDLENDRVELGREGNLHQKESDSRSVQVMTMHASKGLQFPVVYLATRGAPTPRSPRAVRWVDNESKEPGLRCFPQLYGSKETVASPAQQQGEVLGKEQAMQERQRLYYVALTRAQLLLFVPCRIIVTVRAGKESESCTDDLSRRLQGWKDEPSSTVAGHDENLHLPPLPGMGGFEVKDSLRELEALSVSSDVHKETLEALQALNLSNRARREESYTSLTHATSAGERDVDCAQEVATETANTLEPVAESLPLPRGKHIGIAWHGILEKLLSQGDLEPLLPSELGEAPKFCRELLEGELRRNGVLAAARRQGLEEAAVMDASWKLCREALLLKWCWMEDGQEREVRLCSLPATSRLPEVEFHLREGSEPLLGFMDLVFRWPLEDGGYRYYVLDWKSNSLDRYDQDSISRSVHEARYDDQARLYCHALHRWLSSRLGKNYDPKLHLGGALYVYMRGLNSEVQPLWFHRASPEKDSARVLEMLEEMASKRGKREMLD